MNKRMDEVLRAARIEHRTLELWVEQRWLLPSNTPDGPSFSDRDVARARLIVDLSGTFGVNDEGIDVILHLVDQLHGMRRAVAELRDSLGQVGGGRSETSTPG